MNQLGPIFKEKREKEGKSIDDAVKETKIAKKYLIAIESENFDIFPGETYLIGFIRNYAQFLGLDPDEMVQRYKSYKIQEQPTPIEQLTARPKRSKYFILIVIILVIIAGSILAYFKINNRKIEVSSSEIEKKAKKVEEPSKARAKTKAGKETENVINMEESELIKDFKTGDKIVVPVKGKQYKINIDEISNNLDFTVEGIPFSIEKNEVVEIDFDRDGRKDLLLKINKINRGSINLTIKRIYKSEVKGSLMPEIAKSIEGGGQSKFPDVVIYKEGALNAIPATPEGSFVILTGYEKKDIEVSIVAKDTCYVGYITDKEDKKEKLLNVGDKLSFKAKDRVFLTLANAGAVELSVNNVSLKNLMGSQVIAAKEIAWYKNKENSEMYDLAIRDVKTVLKQ